MLLEINRLTFKMDLNVYDWNRMLSFVYTVMSSIICNTLMDYTENITGNYQNEFRPIKDKK